MKTRLISLLVLLFFISGFPLVAETFLDTTFDPGTGVNGFVESAVVQPDGKILICGNFTSFNGVTRNYIARLNSNGSLDTTFLATPNYWVRYMALQPNGKILIGGFFTTVEGEPRNRVARLNANGTVDPTFNPGAGCEGRIVEADPTDPFLFAIGLQNDGKMIIGGNFTNYNGTPRRGVARLNSDGSLDSSFSVGDGVDSWVRSILVLPSGQVYLSGWFQNYNSHGHDRMVRLNHDGSADETFKTDIGYSTSIYSMAQQSDGKVIVGGHSVNTNSPFQQEIVRLNLDGSYDLTFNPGGSGANDKVESVVLQPDGKILIAGYFNQYNGTLLKNIARLNSDGSLDTGFSSVTDNWIWTIALQHDGKFLVAGAFSTVDGVSRNGVARLNANSITPPPTDLIPPTVTIKSPNANARISNPRITGTAADNVRVDRVLYRIGSNEFAPAQGTTVWVANAILSPGNNTIEVKSVDAAGNESTVVSRTFFYVPSAPFTSISGIYNGLFSETNRVDLTTAGFITLNLRKNGVISGYILLEGRRVSFFGKLDFNNSYQKTILRRGQSALDLNFQLNETGSLSGTITQDDKISIVVADRAPSSINSARTNYTLLIPPGENPAISPGGYGFGNASVDTRGRIRFRGGLGDGTILQQSTTASADGRWPFYASLYRGQGLILGWLSFTNETDSDLRGENVSWIKLPGVRGNLYTNGFSLSGTVIGSIFDVPRSASPISWTAGSLEFNGGDLAESLTNEVTLGNHNRLVIASTNKTLLNIVNSSGLLNGSFIAPNARRRTVFRGAYLQKQQWGAGTFLGATQSGFFSLQDSTPADTLIRN